ncbi:yscU, partial [Vibrio parahaemolyticus EKP-008]
MSGEKTEQP